MQRVLLTLALIATAGVSYAQTMPSGEPTDPYGRPLLGRNDWVRQPGDRPGPAAGSGAAMTPSTATAPAAQPMATAPTSQPMATAPAMQPMATAPAMQPTYEKSSRNNKLEKGHATGAEPIPMDATGRRQAAFKDEYGFRYDSQGNRLDARGNIISPHIPQR
jgi:hypothetical protein